jgi:hypothetical protein
VEIAVHRFPYLYLYLYTDTHIHIDIDIDIDIDIWIHERQRAQETKEHGQKHTKQQHTDGITQNCLRQQLTNDARTSGSTIGAGLAGGKKKLAIMNRIRWA